MVGYCRTTMYLEHIFRLDKTKSFMSGLKVVESLSHVALKHKYLYTILPGWLEST